MAIRTGVLFFALFVGCLAVPVPEQEIDLSIFFDNSPADPHARIVGGNVAANGAHPWMVAFVIGANVRSMHCGGSIISPRTILTAAHCIVPVQQGNSVRSDVRLIAGSNRFNTGGVALTVSGARVHPQYNSNIIKNDIGTLFTTNVINFNNVIRAIPVSFDNVGAGVQARVAGFGRTGANAPASQQLLEITVPTLGPQQCVQNVVTAANNLNINAPAVNPNIELCTFHSAGRGTCRGDSGSALVRVDRGHQIGVVSWGFPCALGAPDVFVRVSAFQSWLAQNTMN